MRAALYAPLFVQVHFFTEESFPFLADVFAVPVKKQFAVPEFPGSTDHPEMTVRIDAFPQNSLLLPDHPGHVLPFLRLSVSKPFPPQ